MSRVVRVGIVDSGINPRDSQVGRIEGGIGIRFGDGDVSIDEEWQDALGHGTAVAATIRGLAPDAALYSVRVFHRTLEAHVEALLRAVEWATAERLDLLNSSLGCAKFEREAAFRDVCARARSAGVAIVSAADMLPGTLPGVLAVRADVALEEGRVRFDQDVFYAAPWARKRGELPRETNFHGTSFAVARVTGLAATILSRLSPRDPDALRTELVSSSLRRG